MFEASKVIAQNLRCWDRQGSVPSRLIPALLLSRGRKQSLISGSDTTSCSRSSLLSKDLNLTLAMGICRPISMSIDVRRSDDALTGVQLSEVISTWTFKALCGGGCGYL